MFGKLSVFGKSHSSENRLGIAMNKVSKLCRTILAFALLVQASVSATAQDRYAVLVGVEKYDPGSFESLQFSEDDAIQLGELLEDYGYKSTVMTTQADSPKLQPYTAENILNAIKSRVNSCEKGDTLLVSLSGHGIQFIDEEELSTGVKETYFCPSTADKSDKSTLIPISELVDLINSSAASRKLLLIDACRNEVESQIAKNKSSTRKIKLEPVHENRKSIPGGMSVLFSCSSEQVSWESNELERSVFSYFVTEYFDGNADERYYEDGKLTLDNLVAFVRKKTNDYVFDEITPDGQNPVIRGESANWPVATVEELSSYKDVDFEVAMRHAKLGCAKAQYYVGDDYYYAIEEGKDYGAAMEWYQKAAEQGHAGAQNSIGYLYNYGFGVGQDYSEAMQWYRKAAEQGDADAQYGIAYLYHNGFGVEQDYSEAMQWYRKAAEQGSASAQNSIGDLYEDGVGVEEDYSQAMQWYLKAAEQGNASAQNSIGYLYNYGFGVGQDYSEAMQWYRKAAEQGYSAAEFNIAVLYKDGLGVEQDYFEAMQWYRKSAEQGNSVAQQSLGYLYNYGLGVEQDYSEAMQWYRKAAEQGYSRAQNNIGDLYYWGHGVQKDRFESIKWFRQAAESGNSDAQFSLGYMLKYGQGTSVDSTEARQWLQKSAEQGNQNAIEELKK